MTLCDSCGATYACEQCPYCIRIAYDKEAAVYVSYCPVYKIFSQGDSEAEALEAILGAIKLRADFMYHRGLGS